MRQKLFKKQFGAIALIVFLSLSFILIILTFMYNNYLAEEKYKSLQKTCESVSEFTKYNMSQQEIVYDEYSVYYIMHNLSNVADIDVFMVDKNGVIRLCACEEWGQNGSCEHTGTAIDTSVIDSIIADDKNTLSTLDIYKGPHYTAARNITDANGENTGYIVATDSIDDARNLMKKIAYIYIISAIVPLVLMFVAISLMTYRLTRPLRLMSDAARAMSRGDFSRRVPVTSDDEIGQLAVSFNQMTNSLARLEEVRKSFIANVSHELKTPMTTIGGFIDGIIDGTIPQEKQSYYLGIVHDEIKRLSRMVESMLNISRLESKETELKLEAFDFKEQVLGVVVSQEQRIVKKGLDIVGLDTLPDITIKADKDLIYRVVYNLVDNAIKFTNDGGKIEFNIKGDLNNLTFRIQNTGKGIPQGELPYVFERFYKVDKSRSANKESTGLGLYIVKTIIKNHGGAISVSSVEDKFTAFEFNLPIGR